MTRPLQPSRLNLMSFARETSTLSGAVPLQKMERLAEEVQRLEHDLTIKWEARGELRPATGASGSGDDAVWLHLHAQTVLPLTCQRCMAPVETPVQVDQWYRFVETEDIAMAEDDASEEDLLVMEPQFDLLALLEDELLMGLPLVPMHDECPPGTATAVRQRTPTEERTPKPNPFAVLSVLKKK
ncbi:MAG: hypothetical protein JWP47_1448 [Polaromonas sp.]|nr:hypothetical protein [Polaromonas sp.]